MVSSVFLLLQNQNRAKGGAVEIVRAAAKYLKVGITFIYHLPWKRAKGYMNTGKIDMLVGHYLNSEREQNWLVSDGLFVDDIRIVYLNKKFQIMSIKDLKGLIGVKPRGASLGSFLDEYTAGKYQVIKLVSSQGVMQ